MSQPADERGAARRVLDVDVEGTWGDFQLQAALQVTGGVTLLVGPSGAGKSTLLQVVAGTRGGAVGRITFDGRPWLTNDAMVPAWQRRAPLVHQVPMLWPHQRVGAQLRYGGDWQLDRIASLMQIDGLLERWPASLSGGEARRVAIARALASKPSVLLLDEPLTGLEPRLAAQVAELILDAQRALELVVLWATHAPDRIAGDHRVALMQEGRVHGVGTRQALLAAGTTRAGAQTLGLPNRFHAVVVERALDARTVQVSVGDASLQVASPSWDAPVGSWHYLLVSPDALVLAAGAEPTQLSVRNRLAGRVTSLLACGDAWRIVVDVGGIAWVAEITTAAVDDLKLKVGADVWVCVKARAFRWARAPQRADSPEPTGSRDG